MRSGLQSWRINDRRPRVELAEDIWCCVLVSRRDPLTKVVLEESRRSWSRPFHSVPLPTYWSSVESLLANEKVDVLFRCFPVEDTLSFPLRKQVTFVPDLAHEHYPDFFNANDLAARRRSFSRLIRGSGAVGTISQHARCAINAHYQNRFGDVFLMPPASQLDAGRSSEEVSSTFAEKIKSLQPYFFFPAKIWPHKNHAMLLRAFERFRRSHAGYRKFSLVLSGHPRGWEALAAGQDSTAVSHLGFVSRDELSLLYRNAAALVFLSLYEGFGMPVLEAFGLQCPVLCSHSASLPEIAQDAALLVDPNDADAAARAMASIISDEKLRASLVEKGKKRYQEFSWERSALILHEALTRVHERPAHGEVTVGRVTGTLVSIVTPSYNQGRFIGRTIDSVLAQTYPNTEYRVVDRGSTDATLDVLRSYGAKINWLSEPDRGQAHAINKGFARGKGEVRAYLNADDVLLPNAVETVVDLFSRNPEVDMFYGDAHYLDDEDRVTGSHTTDEYSFERLMHDCCVWQPAAFWTTKIAQTTGPFDESLNYVMDYDYWLRIDRAGGVLRHVPHFFASSRHHPETKTLLQRKMFYAELFKVCRRHGGYVSRNYVQGYWHYRFHEQPGPILKLAGLIPDVEKAVMEYHVLRFGKQSLFFRSAVWAAIGKERRRSLRARPTPKRGSSGSVQGFWDDGWLAPLAHFASAGVRSGRPLRLCGRPAVDCHVKIESGAHSVFAGWMKGGVDTTIEFIARNGEATLRFDRCHIDTIGRETAFFVTYTNLFSEQEL